MTLDSLYRDSVSRMIMISYLKQPRVVLDAGAGSGLVSKILAELGCQIVAVDFAPSAVRSVKMKMPVIDCIVADVRNLPFKERSFDDEILWGTLEYEGVANEAIMEASRVIRERLIFTAWNHDSPLSILARVIYRDHPPAMFSRERMATVLKAPGLKLSSLQGLFLILPAYLVALRKITKAMGIPVSTLAFNLAQINGYLCGSRVTSLLCPVIVACLSREQWSNIVPLDPETRPKRAIVIDDTYQSSSD